MPQHHNSMPPCERPDVLHIIEPFSFGCLTALSSIVTATDGLRHAVAHGTARALPDAEGLFPPETVLFALPALRREIAPRADWTAWRELSALIRRLRPRVVHCHSSKAGVLGRLAARRHGMPSLYTPHGFAFLQTDVSPLRRRLFHAIEWSMARVGNAIAACGKQEYDMARALCPPSSPVFFIPNSLNAAVLDAVLAEAAPPPSSRLRAGICGRMTFARNAEWIVRAAAATHGQADWTWIGCGEEGACLPDTIRRTPFLVYGDALREMRRLDVYVQPSRWEGLSFSILEAMYLGKAVVAFRVPANAAVIRHGETGFLVDSAEEMAACVARLAVDADLRARVGAAAHAYAAREHDARVVYRQYADIYARLAVGAL